MTCEYRDAVAAQLLGGVPVKEALELDAHVLGCEECAAVRREFAVVRTMLDSLGPQETPVPDDITAPPLSVVDGVATQRQRRSRRELRTLALVAAAAFLLGFVPTGVLALRGGQGSASGELAGTGAAPGAWGTVKLHARAEGTIVDLEAGDLPTDGGQYEVTVRDGQRIIATQRFRVSSDGWAQVLLSTEGKVTDPHAVSVRRVAGGRASTVLS